MTFPTNPRLLLMTSCDSVGERRAGEDRGLRGGESSSSGDMMGRRYRGEGRDGEVSWGGGSMGRSGIYVLG